MKKLKYVYCSVYVQKTMKTNQSNFRPSWNTIFMDLCESVARRSTCYRIQTSAVIVYRTDIVSIGYNGTASGQPHCVDTWNESDLRNPDFYTRHHTFSTNNEIHAEVNAIVNAARKGVPCEGTTMYTLYAPCIHCAKLIYASGIKCVLYKHAYDRETDGIEYLTSKLDIRKLDIL